MKRLILIAIASYVSCYVVSIDASCTYLAGTPGETSWKLADQIRAAVSGYNTAGDDVYIVTQSDLPLTINNSGVYRVIENLVQDGTADAITIQSTNATIDFGGHTLTQRLSAVTNRSAIAITGNLAYNLVITNGTILLDNGGALPGALSPYGISRLNTVTNIQQRIFIRNMSIHGDIAATGNRLGYCIYLEEITEGTIENCVCNQAEHGIFLGDVETATQFYLSHNLITNVSQSGITLMTGSAVHCVSNWVINCQGIGYNVLNGYNDVVFEECVCLGSTNGFNLDASTTRISLKGCILKGISGTAIQGNSATQHIVTNCSVTNSGTDYAGAFVGVTFLPANTNTANYWMNLAG